MKTLDSILVPVDFSQACANALNRARLIAAEHRAQVTLLHVVDPSNLRFRREPRSAPDVDQAVAEVQASLRRCAAQFSGLQDVRIAQAVCVGDPVEEVALAAQQADLLVIGVKKTNALEDFLFGAPTERFLRLSRCPVLLTKQPAWSRYRKLLVPVQLSVYSKAVARAAAGLAPTASLHLLHALPPHREPRVRSAEASEVSTWLHHERVRQKAALRLRSMAASFHGFDVTVSTDYGDLAQLTLTARDRIAADLIVACKDEQSCIVDFLLGNAAKRMLAESRCDLLLVPRVWISQGATLLVVPRFDAAAEMTA